MALLHMAVLGRPLLLHGDAALPLASAKTTALLCYLAITREPHTRSTLAGLLWGDLPENRARANLRLALHQPGLRELAQLRIDLSVACTPEEARREVDCALDLIACARSEIEHPQDDPSSRSEVG
jgi:DNA-binding SARP family transcriptional activator